MVLNLISCPRGPAFTSKRRQARQRIFQVARALTGQAFDNDTLIISTSGRNDFRCKGFDVYMEAMKQLNEQLRGTTQQVLSLIEVPCWLLGPRADVQERLQLKGKKAAAIDTPLHTPIISHDLYNLNEDRIVNLIKSMGFEDCTNNNVKVILCLAISTATMVSSICTTTTFSLPTTSPSIPPTTNLGDILPSRA